MAEVAPPRARRDAGTNISTTEAAVTRNNNKDNVTQLLSLATVSSDNKAARISQNDAWTGLNSTSTTSPMDYVKHHSAKPWPTLSWPWPQDLQPFTVPGSCSRLVIS